MGILGKIFGHKKPDYPPLESQSAIAEQLKSVESELRGLVETIEDDIEIVPAPDETYVLFGKLPAAFDLAWIRDGQVRNLSKVVEEQKVPPHRAQALAELIRSAYERSQNDERYSTQLAGRTVVVTPSDGLRQKVHEIVGKLAA
ncbi:MAG: hypothetical protein P8Y69_14385 [Gammaproteobacteria bacterium]